MMQDDLWDRVAWDSSCSCMGQHVGARKEPHAQETWVGLQGDGRQLGVREQGLSASLWPQGLGASEQIRWSVAC